MKRDLDRKTVRILELENEISDLKERHAEALQGLSKERVLNAEGANAS